MRVRRLVFVNLLWLAVFTRVLPAAAASAYCSFHLVLLADQVCMYGKAAR